VINSVAVGISEYRTARAPDVLVAYALGSCIGIALYDRSTGLGGLAHIMLPDSRISRCLGVEERKKYADTAIGDMLAELKRQGADSSKMSAKVAGGADMFKSGGPALMNSIGARNAIAVENELARLGIPVIARDVGEDYGRTVRFDLASGNVTIQANGKTEQKL
jgi:chemotaxis protein CheD